MKSQVKEHATNTSILIAPPAEVEAGADLEIRVSTSCARGCDLRGQGIRIDDGRGERVGGQVALTEFDGAANLTGVYVVKAPLSPGRHLWTVRFPGAQMDERRSTQDDEAKEHEASSAPISFVVRPHTTRVEILHFPDPVVRGEEFKIKIGSRCAAACDLIGAKILVYDHEAVLVATAKLGDMVSCGDSALATAEVMLQAPKSTGRFTWTVKCKPELDVAHAESSRTFHFGVARPTEHGLNVQVVDGETQAPVANARVTARARAYGGVTHEGYTDREGSVRIGVPRDDYLVYVRTEDKECSLPVVPVDAEVTVKAMLLPIVPTP